MTDGGCSNNLKTEGFDTLSFKIFKEHASEFKHNRFQMKKIHGAIKVSFTQAISKTENFQYK